MIKPNILMFHRIKIDETQKIDNLYSERGMLCPIEKVFSLIDKYLNEGFLFGSIEQCFHSQKYFHLSFDDGFKEHLPLAKKIKAKYQINNKNATFSVNVGNSIHKIYSGMDLIYQIIKQKQVNKLCEFLRIDVEGFSIAKVKQIVAKLRVSELIELYTEFESISGVLNKTFLNENEILELSELFTIASHGITHRFLTYHKNDSKKEIINSKFILEQVIRAQVDTFCYPEGKSDFMIQNYCKEAGFQFGLSINQDKNNAYCIGRIIV